MATTGTPTAATDTRTVIMDTRTAITGILTAITVMRMATMGMLTAITDIRTRATDTVTTVMRMVTMGTLMVITAMHMVITGILTVDTATLTAVMDMPMEAMDTLTATQAITGIPTVGTVMRMVGTDIPMAVDTDTPTAAKLATAVLDVAENLPEAIEAMASGLPGAIWAVAHLFNKFQVPGRDFDYDKLAAAAVENGAIEALCRLVDVTPVAIHALRGLAQFATEEVVATATGPLVATIVKQLPELCGGEVDVLADVHDLIAKGLITVPEDFVDADSIEGFLSMVWIPGNDAFTTESGHRVPDGPAPESRKQLQRMADMQDSNPASLVSNALYTLYTLCDIQESGKPVVQVMNGVILPILMHLIKHLPQHHFETGLVLTMIKDVDSLDVVGTVLEMGIVEPIVRALDAAKSTILSPTTKGLVAMMQLACELLASGQPRVLGAFMAAGLIDAATDAADLALAGTITPSELQLASFLMRMTVPFVAGPALSELSKETAAPPMVVAAAEACLESRLPAAAFLIAAQVPDEARLGPEIIRAVAVINECIDLGIISGEVALAGAAALEEPLWYVAGNPELKDVHPAAYAQIDALRARLESLGAAARKSCCKCLKTQPDGIKFNHCSRCGLLYDTRGCQVADWKRGIHRTVCKARTAYLSAGAAPSSPAAPPAPPSAT